MTDYSALQVRIRALRQEALAIEKQIGMDDTVLRMQITRAAQALESAEHQTAVALKRAA